MLSIPSVLLFSPFEKGFVHQHTRKNGTVVQAHFTKRPPKKIEAKHFKRRSKESDAGVIKKMHTELEEKKKKHKVLLEAAKKHHEELTSQGPPKKEEKGLTHKEKLDHLQSEINSQQTHIDNHSRKQEHIKSGDKKSQKDIVVKKSKVAAIKKIKGHTDEQKSTIKKIQDAHKSGKSKLNPGNTYKGRDEEHIYIKGKHEDTGKEHYIAIHKDGTINDPNTLYADGFDPKELRKHREPKKISSKKQGKKTVKKKKVKKINKVPVVTDKNYKFEWGSPDNIKDAQNKFKSDFGISSVTSGKGYITKSGKKEALKVINKFGSELSRMYDNHPEMRKSLNTPGKQIKRVTIFEDDKLKKLRGGKMIYSDGVKGVYSGKHRELSMAGKFKPENEKGLVIGGDHAVDRSLIGVFRHEFGHSYYDNHELAGKWDKLLTGLGVNPGHEKKGVGRDKKSGEYWSKNVSKYSSTNNHEAFAESFAAYTHSDYGEKQSLPKEIERFMDKYVGRSVQLKKGFTYVSKSVVVTDTMVKNKMESIIKNEILKEAKEILKNKGNQNDRYT